MLEADVQNIHMWFTIAMMVMAVIAYGREWLSMEVTSLLLISVLLVFFYNFPLYDESGSAVLDIDRLLIGFANPALISVLCLLVIGQAIVQTGALNEIASIILRFTRGNAFLALAASLLFVAIVSGFLNNTPVVVIFIPIMAAIAKGAGISASKVMIPLSYASILGGMTTLIGSSTNLLVSGILHDMGLPSLSFFDFTLPGLILMGVGLIYVTVIVPRLLPDRASLVRSFREDDNRQFLAQFEISYRSDFAGKKLENGMFPGVDDITVKMVQRGEQAFLPPFDEQFTLRPRDVAMISAGKKELSEFFANNENVLSKYAAWSSRDPERNGDDEAQADLSMAEIVVSPSSKAVGKTLEQMRFYHKYKSMVLAVQRQSRTIRSKMTDSRLAPGDVLLVMGEAENIMSINHSGDFLLMEWSQEDFHSGSKAGLAALIFLCVVGLAAFGILPIVISALLGVAGVITTGCLNIRQAARALDMKIVLMVAASLALGTAMQATGGASYIAHGVISLLQGAAPIVVMSTLFLLMAALTNVLSNNAAAVLFTPIAINIAVQLGVNPMMFVFAVIFACNCSFITPIGYQTNLMVMGPGHHKFTDFIKAGIPLALIMWMTYSIYAFMVY